jgi:hypothetical protein
MKTIFLRLLTFLLTVFGISTGVHAQVWHADPNVTESNSVKAARKYVKLFQNQSCSGSSRKGKLERPSNIDGVSGKSWKITNPKNVQRTEFSRTTGNSQNFVHKKNKNYYYSWRWRVNVKESNFNDSEITVFQWKTTGVGNDSAGGSQNYPLAMTYKKGTLLLNYFAPCKINNRIDNWSECTKRKNGRKFPSSRRSVLKSISVSENQWVDIVLRIQRGANESGKGAGKVQLWINGTLQTLNGPNGSGKSITLKTDDAPDQNIQDDSVYPKWGVYNKNACNYTITTWINKLKIYDNYKAAVRNLRNTRPTDKNRRSAKEKTTIDTQNTKEVIVYPNPSNDVFNIDLKGITKAKIEIIDLFGKIIYTTSTEKDRIQLSISNLFAAGLYTIKVTDSQNKSYINKLLIK